MINKDYPEKMKAAYVYVLGDTSSIEIEEIPTPRIDNDKVLVKVHAFSITRDELTWPSDRIPFIPSYEFSGTIFAVGSSVEAFKIGDEVFGLTKFDRNGVAQEYIQLSPDEIAIKPDSIDHITAATIPLPALTAWQGLFDHGNLKKNDRVLIHGVTGGVGQFVSQIAKMTDTVVIGTSHSSQTEKVSLSSVDRMVYYDLEDFTSIVEDIDIVFDTVGNERLEKSALVVKENGYIISIYQEPPSTTRADSLYFVVEQNKSQLELIAQCIEDGKIKSRIKAVYPFEDVKEAFDRSMSNKGSGKVVVVFDSIP